jgi:hypothetical protein
VEAWTEDAASPPLGGAAVSGVASLACKHTLQSDIVCRMRWIMTDRTSRAPLAVLCGVLALSVAVLVIAWGTGSWTTSKSSGDPGAQLRTLNALAKEAWRTPFEATYSYTGPVFSLYGLSGLPETTTYSCINCQKLPARPRYLLFTIAQQGSKSRLAIPGMIAIDEGGQQSFVCRKHQCLADSPLTWIETPPFFYVLRNLADGNTFWADTQGYPITTADLASRGVSLAFSTATFAGRPSTCVTMTYRRDANGQTLTSGHYRMQRWCVNQVGIVDSWRSGRASLVLTSFTAHPPASAFLPPPGDKVGFPK